MLLFDVRIIHSFTVTNVLLILMQSESLIYLYIYTQKYETHLGRKYFTVVSSVKCEDKLTQLRWRLEI